MFNHSLFELLKTLSNEEKNKLSDFISSPYFNKSKKIVKFYDEIINHYPSFTDEGLTKEKLFRKLNPVGEYNDSTIRNLFHDLQKLVMKFIVQERFNSMKNVQDDYLLKELTFRNQLKLFHRNVKRMEDEIINTKCIQTGFLNNRYIFNLNKYNFSIMHSEANKQKKAEQIVNSVNDGRSNYIIYFLTEMLGSYVELIKWEINFNISTRRNLFGKFIESISIDFLIDNFRNDNKYIYFLEIYDALYKTFKYFKEEKYYFKYKNIIVKHADKLNQYEMHIHYSNLRNYCTIVKNISDKKKKFKAELLNLNEIILENEYYKSHLVEYLHQDYFSNILKLGVEMKDSLWLKKFIKKYIKKLNSKNIDNMRNYGYAYLYFKQSNYEKSLDYINKFNTNEHSYKFEMRMLRLKDFFGLKYYEESLSLIHAYRENLRKCNEFSNKGRLMNNNFLYFTEKLVMFMLANTNIDLGVIKKQITECESITSEWWLLDKIKEIQMKNCK